MGHPFCAAGSRGAMAPRSQGTLCLREPGRSKETCSKSASGNPGGTGQGSSSGECSLPPWQSQDAAKKHALSLLPGTQEARARVRAPESAPCHLGQRLPAGSIFDSLSFLAGGRSKLLLKSSLAAFKGRKKRDTGDCFVSL